MRRPASATPSRAAADTTQLSLLNKFGEGGETGPLPGLIQTFRAHVLERKLSEHECDVLLATACGAKGLEWDNVKVLDDYRRLMTFERVPSDELQPGKYLEIYEEGLIPAGVPMRFVLQNDWKGDELNSWYVAVTRARQRLQLPARFAHLHTAVWSGAGYSDDPSDPTPPQYSPEELEGINALLAKMRGALARPGPEFQSDEEEGSSQGSTAPTDGFASPGATPASGSASQAPAGSPAGSAHGTPSFQMRSLHFS